MGKRENREMMAYVADQLSDLEDFRYIPMMGGYICYYDERIFGGIYESGELLIKDTEAARRYMPDSRLVLPYEGAGEMLVCTILDNRRDLQEMIREMWQELPPRKTRKKKGAA